MTTSIVRKILVPTDFSDASDQAVEYGARLACALGATVYLVHVVEDTYAMHGAWDYYVRDTAEILDRQADIARSKLADAAVPLEKRGLQVATEARLGSAADEIVLAAQHYGADLIVMATHGRSGLPHLLLGSVAERVIRHATCPVVAVTAQAFEHVGLTLDANELALA